MIKEISDESLTKKIAIFFDFIPELHIFIPCIKEEMDENAARKYALEHKNCYLCRFIEIEIVVEDGEPYEGKVKTDKRMVFGRWYMFDEIKNKGNTEELIAYMTENHMEKIFLTRCGEWRNSYGYTELFSD